MSSPTVFGGGALSVWLGNSEGSMGSDHFLRDSFGISESFSTIFFRTPSESTTSVCFPCWMGSMMWRYTALCGSLLTMESRVSGFMFPDLKMGSHRLSFWMNVRKVLGFGESL